MPECPACQASGARYAFEKSDYKLYGCQRCLSLFVHPQPTNAQLKAFYNNAAIEKLSSVCWTGESASEGHLTAVWQRALVEIVKGSGYGPLLDVGCGAGHFLHFARSRGFTDLTGLEIVPQIAERARAVAGAKVIETELEHADLQKNTLVGVTLWDVVEHLGNLRSTLTDVYQLLRPGGSVVITTCNRNGFSLRTLGKRSTTIQPPEHILFLTKRGLSEALKQVGFEVSAIWSFSIYLREWLPRLRRSVKSANEEDRAPKSYSLLFARSTPLRYAMNLADFFLKQAELGDELIAIGRKPMETKDSFEGRSC